MPSTKDGPESGEGWVESYRLQSDMAERLAASEAVAGLMIDFPAAVPSVQQLTALIGSHPASRVFLQDLVGTLAEALNEALAGHGSIAEERAKLSREMSLRMSSRPRFDPAGSGEAAVPVLPPSPPESLAEDPLYPLFRRIGSLHRQEQVEVVRAKIAEDPERRESFQKLEEAVRSALQVTAL